MDLDQKRKFKNKKCLEEFPNFGWRPISSDRELSEPFKNHEAMTKFSVKKIGWKVIVTNVTSLKLNRSHINILNRAE